MEWICFFRSPDTRTRHEVRRLLQRRLPCRVLEQQQQGRRRRWWDWGSRSSAWRLLWRPMRLLLTNPLVGYGYKCCCWGFSRRRRLGHAADA